jgi:hypothetical protein
MLDKIKSWVFEGEMNGFDTLASTEVGDFDYMSLLKGGAGILSGAGGMMSGGQSGTPAAGTPASAELERMRIQAQGQAESSARTWKIVGGIALGVLGLGAVALIARPAKVA